jgi:hypothetical protein
MDKVYTVGFNEVCPACGGSAVSFRHQMGAKYQSMNIQVKDCHRCKGTGLIRKSVTFGLPEMEKLLKALGVYHTTTTEAFRTFENVVLGIHRDMVFCEVNPNQIPMFM